MEELRLRLYMMDMLGLIEHGNGDKILEILKHDGYIKSNILADLLDRHHFELLRVIEGRTFRRHGEIQKEKGLIDTFKECDLNPRFFLRDSEYRNSRGQEFHCYECKPLMVGLIVGRIRIS